MVKHRTNTYFPENKDILIGDYGKLEVRFRICVELVVDSLFITGEVAVGENDHIWKTIDKGEPTHAKILRFRGCFRFGNIRAHMGTVLLHLRRSINMYLCNFRNVQDP
jgi:hypothetical protein